MYAVDMLRYALPRLMARNLAKCCSPALRFLRTLKEQLLWLRSFRNVEELREALWAFKEQYNEQWLIEQNCFRSPRRTRQDFLAIGAAA